MSNPRCPHCKRGAKEVAIFNLNGVDYEDAYCGFCGKTWPKPLRPAQEGKD